MKKKVFESECYIVDETDVMNYVTRTATKAQRKKFDIGKIYINGAVCLSCKDFIRSKNRHDFKYCSCGKVAVDGGSWYARRLGNIEDYVNVIEYFYGI